MQVALRRLIIASAISLGGVGAGVALGNFVASQQKMTGAQELAAYKQILSTSEDDAPAHMVPDADFASRSGPTSYTCEGCDSHPYNDVMPGNAMAADTTPLPLYRPVEGIAVPPSYGRIEGAAVSLPAVKLPAMAARQQVLTDAVASTSSTVAVPASNVIITPDRSKAAQPISDPAD